MAKSNRKKRVKGSFGRFVGLPFLLLQSAAYRDLKPAARALLVELMMRFNGSNNGQLFLSQRDAAASLNIRTHTAAAGYLESLVSHGFIRTNVRGSFDNKTNLATTYILTMFAWNGHPPSKEYMAWRPDKSRGRKSAQLGSKKSPLERVIDPALLPVGGVFPAANDEISCDEGGEEQATYNIPSPSVASEPERDAA